MKGEENIGGRGPQKLRWKATHIEKYLEFLSWLLFESTQILIESTQVRNRSKESFGMLNF